MKFLHTSDWHLGMTVQGGSTYKEDQDFVIKEICRIAVQEAVDGILLAGDVFDKSIASQDAIKQYNVLMTKLCVVLNIPVYLVAGNHDGAERISQCNELLKKSGLFIAGSLEKEPQVITVGNVDIYLLPWISTDKVKSVYSDYAAQINSIEDAYKVVLDDYRATFVPGHKHILVGHAFIVDADTSTSDKAAEVGRATMVGSYVFDGFDYVALGHLHGPQQISEHIRYSGSPMAYSFGKEEKQEKSVTIFDTDTMCQSIIPIPQYRRRTTLRGTFDELMKANFEQEVLDGFVRLEVTDSFVGLEAISFFREKYKNLLEISGKNFEREDAKISMTMDEFENMAGNSEAIFERYCEDVLEEQPSDHLLELFKKALLNYEKGVVEK